MAYKTAVPPQAYTRETLTEAFEWLKTQPQAVKDKVSSADGLVQMFLHSRKFGAPTLTLLDESQPKLEDLISVENFKNELKSLAQGLKEFETSVTDNGAAIAPPHTTTVSARAQQGESMSVSPPPTTSPPLTWNTTPPSAATAPNPSSSLPPWDEKSSWAIRATRERFNLSSEHEAVRMLIAAGFDTLRQNFPKGY